MRSMSVVQITNASTYDHGVPKTGGLQDARMGSMDRSILCQTCHMSHCAGHYGLLDFPMRVYFPGHVKRLVFLLRCICPACCSAIFSKDQVSNILENTAPGIDRLKSISDFCRSKIPECSHCGTSMPQYTENNRILIVRSFTKESLQKMCEAERTYYSKRLYPDEVYSILNKISDEVLQMLGFTPSISHPKSAVLNCILVLPPAQRPTLRIADGGKGRGEDDMTMLYQDVIRAKLDLEQKIEKNEKEDQLFLAFAKMQLMVACLIKNTLRKTVDIKGLVDRSGARGGVRTMRDLEHRLKGKTGRLRGTLNAKRTDFSARTVVGIDMTQDIWKLGIPETRMKTLTVPEKATQINMSDLQDRIVRGASAKDGAVNILQPIAGQEPRIVFLGLMNEEQRRTLAASLRVGWIVERHIKNGDWVLFNRQPTLHKMNMQAFQVYGIKGLTFRLPLPATRPFNADYDGDEMNMHVPQSIQAIAEAQELMAVPHHMISPSNTASIIAPVQETLVSIYRLTRRDALLTRDAFMQLMAQIDYSATDPDYSIQPFSTSFSANVPVPAILKSPKGPRWTGKQILQCLLPKTVQLTRAVRDGDMTNNDHWLGEKEEIVVVRNGDLLLGRLCKATIGGGASLVHNLWKDVSPWAAAKFVSDVQRIGNYWNQVDALCIGIRDCMTDDSVQLKVDDLVAAAMSKADSVEATKFPADVKEMRISGIVQDVLRSAGALVLKNIDQSSALATVVTSGSKGNALNLSQIAAVVGQQSINGRRVQHRPSRVGHRGLICFKPNDRRPEALGFVSTSYLMGQTESEFYHCMMAGREGIVATAIGTATSGYNQRKMVKIQEGQIVAYDRSVRVTNHDIISLHYGGDDYDATCLERVKIPAVRFSDASIASLSSYALEKELCLRARDHLRFLSRPLIPGDWNGTMALPFHMTRLQDQVLAHFANETRKSDCGTSKSDSDSSISITQDIHAMWLKSMFKMLTTLHGCSSATLKDFLSDGETALQRDRPWIKAFSVIVLSWTFSVMLESKFTIAHAKWLKRQIGEKIRKALVAPGEAVGTIGATSIGEPSTQGALNVFHFSGIAEKNAMAGVDRFKDLINAAKARDKCNLTALAQDETEAGRLARQFKSVYLSSILERSNIKNAQEETILARREKLILPWVRTWLTPLASKLDKAKLLEATMRRCLTSANAEDQGKEFVVEYTLNKRKALVEKISPKDVAVKIREILLDNALVTASEDFEKEWTIRIRPFGFDAFCVGNLFDSRSACEALLDGLRSQCLVRGLSWISDSYVTNYAADEVVLGGGLGRASFKRVGTLGTDLYEASWAMQDTSLLWSNDVQEVSQILGIEAATLLNHAELQRVLSFDSTYVDPRHTLLLADTMSRCGSVAALNRHKMEELGSSLLQRASFEQTLPVLEEAAFFNRKDPLSGSLERQIVGLPLRVGTGIVNIVDEHEDTEQQTYVAPLEKIHAATSLAPLPSFAKQSAETVQALFGFKEASTWSPHVSGPLLPMLESSATQVYPTASEWWNMLQRGNIAVLRSTLKFGDGMSDGVPKGKFEDVRAMLESYHGWDESESPWVQSVAVYWKFGLTGATACTVVEDKAGPKPFKIHLLKHTDMSTKVSWPARKQSLDVKLLRRTLIEPHAIPSTTVPQMVVIRQRKTFHKDGWKFTLSKEWTGATNLEAEAKVATANPLMRIMLDADSAEAASSGTSLPIHEVLVSRWWSLTQ